MVYKICAYVYLYIYDIHYTHNTFIIYLWHFSKTKFFKKLYQGVWLILFIWPHELHRSLATSLGFIFLLFKILDPKLTQCWSLCKILSALDFRKKYLVMSGKLIDRLISYKTLGPKGFLSVLWKHYSIVPLHAVTGEIAKMFDYYL